MTYEEVKALEKKIKDACTDTPSADNKLIEELRSYLTKDGELDIEACSYLRNNSDIKINHKKINELDHDAIMVGVSYGNMAIEFYTMPCVQ